MSKLEFKPLLSPREIIESGAFGGSYFGEELLYGDTQYCQLFKDLFEGVDESLYLTKKYSSKLNQFKTRSGMGYEYWKEMGWIHDDDPYGWFEWYCKYSLGRRHEDDDRQIIRWQNFCGKTGRWKKRIYSRIHETNNWNISPRIQQSLLHWGYYANEYDYDHWKIINKIN